MLALVACAQDRGREFAKYYDPQGMFVANLPAANDLAVTPAQASVDGPELLSGVVATPPQPSPSAAAGVGGGLGLATTTEQPDQTIYRVLVVSTDTFADLDEMVLYFLTRDPIIDVRVDEPVRVDGVEGRLVVSDVNQEGTITASLAVVLTLGREGTGFLLVATFPPDQWDSERGDFYRVLESFRSTVPPGLTAFPVTGAAA
jgi:hypothetical protein